MLRMAQPIIHHRTDEFRAVIRRISDNLKYLFCTAQPVLTLTSSGTGAMEAAIANTMSAGDELLFVNGGKFGERWGEIARAYGLTAHELTVPWGSAANPQQILEMLMQYPATHAVCLTHSETSTGVFTDIQAITKALRQQGYTGLVMVDGITAVGAHEMRFDDWDLDIVVTGSQKGLMIPPGLAFIALSQRAWEFSKTSTLPKFYFNLTLARASLEADDTPWTPAITLMLGLDEALQMIRQEGVENIWARHDCLASALRAGASALGLELFSSPSSNAVTSILLPENGGAFMKLLKEKYRVTVAAGQENLKGKIFRVSHLGYYDEADMLSILFAIESALSDIGHQHPEGAGLAAAQKVFNQAARKMQGGEHK